jgi:hypothetical protein
VYGSLSVRRNCRASFLGCRQPQRKVRSILPLPYIGVEQSNQLFRSSRPRSILKFSARRQQLNTPRLLLHQSEHPHPTHQCQLQSSLKRIPLSLSAIITTMMTMTPMAECFHTATQECPFKPHRAVPALPSAVCHSRLRPRPRRRPHQSLQKSSIRRTRTDLSFSRSRAEWETSSAAAMRATARWSLLPLTRQSGYTTSTCM